MQRPPDLKISNELQFIPPLLKPLHLVYSAFRQRDEETPRDRLRSPLLGQIHPIPIIGRNEASQYKDSQA
jgi:hypothetical protein